MCQIICPKGQLDIPRWVIGKKQLDQRADGLIKLKSVKSWAGQASIISQITCRRKQFLYYQKPKIWQKQFSFVLDFDKLSKSTNCCHFIKTQKKKQNASVQNSKFQANREVSRISKSRKQKMLVHKFFFQKIELLRPLNKLLMVLMSKETRQSSTMSPSLIIDLKLNSLLMQYIIFHLFKYHI